jgi:hypothetical protein
VDIVVKSKRASAPSAPRGKFFRDYTLTLVPIAATSQSSLREGRGAEARRAMAAKAVPAGGFAVRSRAAWASCLPAL